ncbi:NERD domain-containing protein [Glutamicibacter arilaitensis]|uniref:NERD domain-containing protein n=1 Tax=Glutamicibacter arilaitensis TaxID=256701 RepID=UPI00384EC6AB
MVHCIPAEPDFSDGQSAEKAVWEELRRSLPQEAVLAHSVAIRHGAVEHEIDLLILWPGIGLVAIEVKGGLVGIENGAWYQSDSKGRHPMKDPMAQVQSAAHAFKKWIAEQTGTPLNSRFAHVVCLPYSEVPATWQKADTPRDLLMDQNDLKQSADYLRRAIEDQGGGYSALAQSFAQRISRHLAADFTPEHLETSEALENEDLQEHLTSRQAILLSATRSLPRVKFIGGAGSGKTWMAVEKAKQLAKDNARVGLFCYNKGLGHYLKKQVSGWRQNKPVHIGEFHEYARSLGVPNGTGQDYFDVQMPRLLRELALELPEEEKLDAIIVDEAQDFAPEWWEALLACTKDPLQGKIYAFMDVRQDVYRRWNGEDLGGSFGTAAPLVSIHVDDNLRNTRRIAETFKNLAGDQFKPRGGQGVPVRFVGCSTEDAVDIASDCVDPLISEGWANNQIALLTTNRRHPIHQEHFEQGSIDSEYWPAFHAHEEEFYGHVLGFKGLERSVVVLCINGFKDMSRAVEQLYVGLSRARSLLVVVGDREHIEAACGSELHAALRAARSWSPAITAETVAG